jgi:protein phosphatase
MPQAGPVPVAVLVGLSALVVGLIVTVVVLARSLRRANNAAQLKKEAAPRTTTADVLPQANAKVASVKMSGARPEIGPPKESNDELTRVASFVAPLPRLSLDEDDLDEDEVDEPSLEASIARLFYDAEAAHLEEPTGPNDLILVSAIGQTDRGITRRKNEDAYLIDTHRQLYAVADGMGGHARGDVASKLAIEEIWNAMESPTEQVKGYEDRPRRGRELIAAVERANAAVYREAELARDLQGMGTTIVAARFVPQKQRMYVAYVGDSRCYRFRRGALQLLTKDHTLATRGVVGPLANNISRAVGIAKKVKVDLVVDKPLPDDIILLCSDGLPKMVTDEHIRRILTANEGSLDRAAAQLVLAANAGGGRDNITVVIVRILEVTKTMRTAATIKRQARVEFGPSLDVKKRRGDVTS